MAVDLSGSGTSQGGQLNLGTSDACTEDKLLDLSAGLSSSSNLTGGGGPCLTCFKYTNILWVDPNGNDTTAVKGDIFHPWKTPEAAETAADSNDTIHIMPGTYVVEGLGKDGVNYYIAPGAILQSLPSTGYRSVAIFRDSGVAMTFRVDCRGRLETANGQILHLTNNGTVVYMYADELVQTEFGANNHAMLLEGTMTVYLTYNYADINADNYFFINGEQATLYVHAPNYTRVRTQIISNGGLSYFEGNFASSYSTNSFENSFGARGAGAYMKIKSNYFDSDNTGTTYNGTFDIRDGATIDFEGYMRVSHDRWEPLDVDRTNGGGSRLILRNAHVIYEDVGASKGIIRLNQSGSRCEIYNSILENRNQLAGSHGITTVINTPAGTSSIDMQDTTILLNSTAVGLGAKAIRATGSLEYRFYTDIRSNGGFEGTNIINSTTGIVEPNVKSD